MCVEVSCTLMHGTKTSNNLLEAWCAPFFSLAFFDRSCRMRSLRGIDRPLLSGPLAVHMEDQELPSYTEYSEPNVTAIYNFLYDLPRSIHEVDPEDRPWLIEQLRDTELHDHYTTKFVSQVSDRRGSIDGDPQAGNLFDKIRHYPGNILGA